MHMASSCTLTLLLILEFSERYKPENGAQFPRWATKIDLNSIVSQKAFKLSQIELHDIDCLNDLQSEIKLIFTIFFLTDRNFLPSSFSKTFEFWLSPPCLYAMVVFSFLLQA